MCNQYFHLFYFHGNRDDDDNSDDGGDTSNDGYYDYVLPIPSPTHFLGNHVNDGVDFGDNDHKRLIESL